MEQVDLDKLPKAKAEEFEFLLIGADEKECPPCVQIRKILQEKIDRGEVQYEDVSSEVARMMLTRAKKAEIPKIFAWERKTGETYECDIYLNEEEEEIVLKCGGQVIAIKRGEGSSAS